MFQAKVTQTFPKMHSNSNTGSPTPKAKDYGEGLFPTQILGKYFALVYNSLLRVIFKKDERQLLSYPTLKRLQRKIHQVSEVKMYFTFTPSFREPEHVSPIAFRLCKGIILKPIFKRSTSRDTLILRQCLLNGPLLY